MIDFPNSPAVNDTFTAANGAVYKYDGIKWTVQAVPAPAVVQNNVGRNLIDNALFNVAQRGAGPWTAVGYSLDRWFVIVSGDAATFIQSSFDDAARAQVGDEAATYALSNTFTGNAGAGSYNYVQQAIENVRRLAGKTVTVSFWAAASPGPLKLGVNIQQYFGTGGSPSATVIALPTGASVNVATGFTRYSVTFAIPSIAGKTLGTANDHKTNLQFWYSSGATNNATAGNIGVQSGGIVLWGVQLEIGIVMTPLEKLNPRMDLSNCQRMFQVGFMQNYGYNAAGATAIISNPFPVPMRATPTLVPSGVVNTNATGVTLGAGSNFINMSGTITALGAFAIQASFTASADL
jgi:hypothetical protein